jgi:hypothetical protein
MRESLSIYQLCITVAQDRAPQLLMQLSVASHLATPDKPAYKLRSMARLSPFPQRRLPRVS